MLVEYARLVSKHVRHSFRGYIDRKHIGRLTKEIYKVDLQRRLTKGDVIGSSSWAETWTGYLHGTM